VIDEIPRGLLPLTDSQYILIKYVPRPDGGTDKIPISIATMDNINAHDPANWMNAVNAISQANAMGEGYGIGYVFTDNDPFWFLDVDHCVVDGAWTQPALDMFTLFPAAAIELSHSGEGIHIFGCGDCPDHGTRNGEHGYEFYTSGRFVALTCNMLNEGSAAADYSSILPHLVSTYFPPIEAGDIKDWSIVATADWNGPEDDNVLIQKALNANSVKAAFSNKVTFYDLWECNIPVLSEHYPDPERDYDASSADAAMAQHLAFWTGNNCDRIERIMRRSRLLRPKWDRRERFGYLKRTILKAVARQKVVYSSNYTDPAPVPTGDPSPGDNPTISYMTAENQKIVFIGCVYVRDEDKIWCPDGALLNSTRFKAMYGGHIFQLDVTAAKTTKNAWEAFTESQVVRFPKVAAMCFRPEVESGLIIEEEGYTLVNTYIPVATEQKDGDPARFFDFLARLLPDQRDRDILFSYMAALVQYPGVKFQWCPLIQGAEGNGKTTIIEMLEFCIGRRYSHRANASQLGKNGLKFTGWLENKLFVAIDEIYTHERQEITEALKDVITSNRLEIEGKGRDQYMGDNRANFLMTTNHKDALKVSFNTRRYAVFYTAQQSHEDIVAAGMDGSYFPDLYKWGRSGGWAIINTLLRNHTIVDEFNPTIASQRAPITTSTREAVGLSAGNVEQEILEAIEEGRQGFSGGWISSKALDRLLDQIRASKLVPRNKRREMLAALGYHWHPALIKSEGRVNMTVMQEEGKPKLFIEVGHPAREFTTAAGVLQAYMKAQGYITDDEAETNDRSRDGGPGNSR